MKKKRAVGFTNLVPEILIQKIYFFEEQNLLKPTVYTMHQQV